MAGPKPCLGYPSRTAAIQALRAQQLSTREIAARIGISTTTVSALECSAARTRKQRGRGNYYAGVARTVIFPIDVLDALAPHAARRNIAVNSLVRLIVSTVVDEDMVDAVLDDADDLQRWAE